MHKFVVSFAITFRIDADPEIQSLGSERITPINIKYSDLILTTPNLRKIRRRGS